ncbi:MAG: hypothetical protein AAGI50_13775 [Pseudomonadota bacterium]
MPSIISEGFTIFGDDETPFWGVSDISLVGVSGTSYLAIGSERDGTLAILDPSTETLTSEIALSASSGTEVLTDVDLVDGPSGQRLVTGGRYDDNVGVYEVGAGGTLTQTASVADGSGYLDQISVMSSSVIGGQTYVYAASFGRSGIGAFRLDADDTWIWNGGVVSGSYALGDVTALSSARFHGTEFLFAASGVDAGVTTLTLGSDGTMTPVAVHDSTTGTGLLGLTDLATAEIGSRAFVLAGASETDSLTVLRVSQAGKLSEVDHLVDQSGTRFGGVQDIEVVEHDGRTFVFAAGGDDGVSVFELTYTGKLNHLDTIADDFDTALQNVSAMAVEVVGSIAHVYVGSATDHGVTELLVDLSRSGDEVFGAGAPETLIGTAGDDHLWGRGRDDLIFGEAGDDRLVDGRGNDELTGGPGADVFEFIADGKSDFIMDFEFGVDLIDLTHWEGLYHYSDLTIGTREKGAAIIFGDEIIRLRNPDGTPYDDALIESLGQDDFIFG